jgi:polysaccharide biosynthesis protein PslH
MLKVLWLARSIPLPANSGDKIYTYKLISSLAEAGAHVTYVGLAEQTDEWSESELDRAINWVIVPGPSRSKLASLLDRKPMVSARYGTSNYRSLIRELLPQQVPDVVVLDHYAMVFAIEELKKKNYTGPVVHIAHDFETMVTRDLAASFRGTMLMKLALKLNAIKTAHAEKQLACASDVVATLTEFDAGEFRKIGARRTVALPPGYDGPVAETSWRKDERNLRVAIVGSFEWTVKQLNLANFLAVADSRFAKSGIGIDVVGKVPREFLEAWQPKLVATKFHGFVQDLTPIFQHSRLGLIIEKTGGGFKLKSLDYVFNGLPVAALAKSFEGVPDSVSQHFLVEDDTPALVESILIAVADDVRLQGMQSGALNAAKGSFKWATRARKLLEAVTEVRARYQD